jgi:hypothetical protein
LADHKFINIKNHNRKTMKYYLLYELIINNAINMYFVEFRPSRNMF